MVAMKELKPVHVPSPEHREFRSLVTYRKSLDQRINKLKNVRPRKRPATSTEQDSRWSWPTNGGDVDWGIFGIVGLVGVASGTGQARQHAYEYSAGA